MRIRAEFNNPGKNLRPGMFARVRADLGIRKDCIEVPERALIELQGKTFVWVVDQEGLASQRSVKVGEQNHSNRLILEGLKPAERIIVEGLQKAREGAPVTALTAAQLAAMKSAPAAGQKPSDK
jgi:membrane fusion protein (multidrug efflux system)